MLDDSPGSVCTESMPYQQFGRALPTLSALSRVKIVNVLRSKLSLLRIHINNVCVDRFACFGTTINLDPQIGHHCLLITSSWFMVESFGNTHQVPVPALLYSEGYENRAGGLADSTSDCFVHETRWGAVLHNEVTKSRSFPFAHFTPGTSQRGWTRALGISRCRTSAQTTGMETPLYDVTPGLATLPRPNHPQD